MYKHSIGKESMYMYVKIHMCVFMYGLGGGLGLHMLCARMMRLYLDFFLPYLSKTPTKSPMTLTLSLLLKTGR